MVKLHKAVLLLSLLTLFSSCSEADFSVSAPKGWIVIDRVAENSKRVVKMHPPIVGFTPVFVENIIISIADVPFLDWYEKSIISGLKKDAQYFIERGKGSIEINEYTALWEHHIISANHSSDTLEQKIYFIKDYGSIYQIVCSSKLDQMENFQNVIDEVLNSFKIK